MGGRLQADRWVPRQRGRLSLVREADLSTNRPSLRLVRRDPRAGCAHAAPARPPAARHDTRAESSFRRRLPPVGREGREITAGEVSKANAERWPRSRMAGPRARAHAALVRGRSQGPCGEARAISNGRCAPGKSVGYLPAVESASRYIVSSAAATARGGLFGVRRLLRALRMQRGDRPRSPGDLRSGDPRPVRSAATSSATGPRPTRTTDGRSAWEQSHRALAVFGENIGRG